MNINWEFNNRETDHTPGYDNLMQKLSFFFFNLMQKLSHIYLLVQFNLTNNIHVMFMF